MKAEIEEIRTVAMTMQERLMWLSRKKVTKPALESVMERIFPKKQVEGKEEGESSTRRDNVLAEILDIYDGNDGNAFPEQKGTAYNLLNAITNYTDHSRSTKGDMRAESALFGSGDKLKTNALQMILQEAEKMPDVEQRILVDWKGVGLNVG